MSKEAPLKKEEKKKVTQQIAYPTNVLFHSSVATLMHLISIGCC